VKRGRFKKAKGPLVETELTRLEKELIIDWFIREKIITTISALNILKYLIEKNPYSHLIRWRTKIGQIENNYFKYSAEGTLINFTFEEYLELFKRQSYRCSICGPSSNELILFHGTRKANLDHGTRAVRGILCSHCNLLLGNSGDDIDKLSRAIIYLRNSGKSEAFVNQQQQREPISSNEERRSTFLISGLPTTSRRAPFLLPSNSPAATPNRPNQQQPNLLDPNPVISQVWSLTPTPRPTPTIYRNNSDYVPSVLLHYPEYYSSDRHKFWRNRLK